MAPALAGCIARYVPPRLPAHQVGIVTIDRRASDLTIDRLPVHGMRPEGEVAVAPGCHELTVTFEESYFIMGKEGGIIPRLATSESHDYQTFKPVQFFVPVRPGHTYWVTASFNGDQFSPRISQIDASGESTATILPDLPCDAVRAR